MAAKVSLATGSMSDAIREYIKAHPGASQKEISAGLATAGIKVSGALINKIKYSKPKPARKARVGEAIASRNGVAGTTKAQAIRDAFATLGNRTRPRDVIAHLGQHGVVVSAAQVSAIRQSLHKRGRKAGSNGAASGRSAAAAIQAGTGISLEHLLAAKKLADQVGMQAAQKAVEVLARLGSR